MKGIKKLVGKSVLVKPDPIIKKTKGGLLIPDTVKKGVPRPRRGKVVMSNIDEIKEGMYVRFKPYSEIEIEIDDKKYFILEEKCLVAIES